MTRWILAAAGVLVLGCPATGGDRSRNGSGTTDAGSVEDVPAAADPGPGTADSEPVADVGEPDTAEPPGTCQSRCASEPSADESCQCDAGCFDRQDCCDDYWARCQPEAITCAGRCGDAPDYDLPCQCSNGCLNVGSCCDDWEALCQPALNSCADRCGEEFDPSHPCQCNDTCQSHGNCCADWQAQCEGGLYSCTDRCTVGYDPELPCHCQLDCVQHGNCCGDLLSSCAADVPMDWVKAPAGECDSDDDWDTVIHIADGDTFTTQSGAKVRLVAVDTPEIDSGDCYANEAAAYTFQRLYGQPVCLVKDDTQPNTDRYGRLLRHAFYAEPTLGGEIVMHDTRLVRLGYAQPHYAFVWDTVFAEPTLLMAWAARQAQAGGWKSCGWE